jgi:hypothetical protein
MPELCSEMMTQKALLQSDKEPILLDMVSLSNNKWCLLTLLRALQNIKITTQHLSLLFMLERC